jgi:hypothetical protein
MHEICSPQLSLLAAGGASKLPLVPDMAAAQLPVLLISGASKVLVRAYMRAAQLPLLPLNCYSPASGARRIDLRC